MKRRAAGDGGEVERLALPHRRPVLPFRARCARCRCAARRRGRGARIRARDRRRPPAADASRFGRCASPVARASARAPRASSARRRRAVDHHHHLVPRLVLLARRLAPARVVVRVARRVPAVGGEVAAAAEGDRAVDHQQLLVVAGAEGRAGEPEADAAAAEPLGRRPGATGPGRPRSASACPRSAPARRGPAGAPRAPSRKGPISSRQVRRPARCSSAPGRRRVRGSKSQPSSRIERRARSMASRAAAKYAALSRRNAALAAASTRQQVSPGRSSDGGGRARPLHEARGGVTPGRRRQFGHRPAAPCPSGRRGGVSGGRRRDRSGSAPPDHA